MKRPSQFEMPVATARTSGAFLLESKFLGRGFGDDGPGPSTILMGREEETMLFQIRRHTSDATKIRVDGADLCPEELRSLYEAIERSSPVGGLQKADRKKLLTELAQFGRV